MTREMQYKLLKLDRDSIEDRIASYEQMLPEFSPGARQKVLDETLPELRARLAEITHEIGNLLREEVA